MSVWENWVNSRNRLLLYIVNPPPPSLFVYASGSFFLFFYFSFIIFLFFSVPAFVLLHLCYFLLFTPFSSTISCLVTPLMVSSFVYIFKCLDYLAFLSAFLPRLLQSVSVGHCRSLSVCQSVWVYRHAVRQSVACQINTHKFTFAWMPGETYLKKCMHAHTLLLCKQQRGRDYVVYTHRGKLQHTSSSPSFNTLKLPFVVTA